MAIKNSSMLEVEEYQESAISSAEVGRLFREERERRGLSIKSVSSELHIRQLYLACIEEGRLSELPGYVYVVGFIKSYSKFLDLNSEEILSQLNLTSQPQVVYSRFLRATPPHEQQLPTKKVLFASLTVLFILALLSYIYNNQLENDSLIDDDSLASGERGGDTLSSSLAADPYGQIVEAGNVQENSSQANISSSDSRDESEIVISSAGSLKSEFVQSKLSASNSIESKTDLSTPTSPIANSEITIVAVKDSWVQVMNSKGQSVYVRLMHAGERYTVPASKDAYILNTGNGGGIKFFVNEQETKILGEPGKIMRGILLTTDSLKEYMVE